MTKAQKIADYDRLAAEKWRLEMALHDAINGTLSGAARVDGAEYGLDGVWTARLSPREMDPCLLVFEPAIGRCGHYSPKYASVRVLRTGDIHAWRTSFSGYERMVYRLLADAKAVAKAHHDENSSRFEAFRYA